MGNFLKSAGVTTALLAGGAVACAGPASPSPEAATTTSINAPQSSEVLPPGELTSAQCAALDGLFKALNAHPFNPNRAGDAADSLMDATAGGKANIPFTQANLDVITVSSVATKAVFAQVPDQNVLVQEAATQAGNVYATWCPPAQSVPA